MTTSILSVFTKPTHGNAWLDYVRALKPYDVLLLDPDIQQVSDAYQASPESEITIRRWDWDDARTDQNPHGVYMALRNDPQGLAVQHVAQYSALISEWEREAKRRGIPFPAREQLVMHLVNEPDTNSLLRQINTYTVGAAQGLRGFGLKVDGLNLSTGHPAHLKDGQPDWTLLLPALEALESTGSYAVVHEYYNSLGIRHPDANPWHILRHLWAPRGPKYKIGEFGLEEILNGLLPDHHGWQGRIPPEQMVADTDWYLGKVRDDVVAVRFYMTDFIDRRWRTFNSEPIHAQLIEVGRRHPSKPVTTTPMTTHIPQVSTGPQPAPYSTAYVQVRDGANVRTRPVDGAILTAVPFGEKVSVLGYDSASQWFQVRYGDVTGWTLAALLDERAPEQVPVETVPQPTAPGNAEQAWQRSIAFVLRQEGGLSTDPNDPGNYVNGVFVGTKYGISANAHPNVDIVNLTVEQAKQIYFNSYWIPSGASRLPWPMCLAVLDLAVNAGVGRAKEALNEAGNNFIEFMAWRIAWYTRISNFERYGRAWIRRCAQLMEEAVK